MNRSILIVICDFLLVSLLVFSSPDINRVTGEGPQRTPKFELTTNQPPPTGGQDLAAVMKLALNDERRSRDQLQTELARSREAAIQQQAMLSEREKQVQSVQERLRTTAEESLRLEQQRANLQLQQANLQQQFAEAQTNIEVLSRQLQSSSSEALLSKEKLAQMEVEARKKAEQSAALQQQLSQLASSNQVVLAEKQQLATQLQVAEVEKRHATEQVAHMTEEVKTEREEKAKLAEGVKVLASKSGELATEIRDNRPLTANSIFNEFLTNRVDARFVAVRPGVFGDATRSRDTKTVLVNDGTNTFALCHVQDTPLTLAEIGTEWEGLTGTLSRNATRLNIRSLSFCWPDPRVVLMPVTDTEARQLGCRVYRVSSDPFKFQDTVVVGAQAGYYGECKFEIDQSTPDYVKLDRNVLKGLFGKFNPSRGDLIFSKTGELLGIMANDTYCLRIRTFDATATVRFGQDVRPQHTGLVLSELYAQVSQLPSKLQ
jgi:hypothetical protein